MSKTPEHYSPAATDPFEFENFEQQDAVMRELKEQLIGTAENGQKTSAVHANRGANTHVALVRPNAVFANNANVDQHYVAAQYVAAMPQYDYLSLDLAGHGLSDPLTPIQREDIRKFGDLGDLALTQVEAALDIMPDLNEVILTGEAVGGLMAVEFAVQAAKKGITVKHLFDIDPMGLETRSPLQLASSYLKNAEKNRINVYQESYEAGEQRLEEDFSKRFTEESRKYGPVKNTTQKGHLGLLVKERTIATFMLRKSPFTHDTGMRSLEQALELHPNMWANLLFAGKSVVGRLTSPVQERLNDLQARHPERLEYDVWPFDSQNIGLARNQPRLAKYIKDNLEAEEAAENIDSPA